MRGRVKPGSHTRKRLNQRRRQCRSRRCLRRYRVQRGAGATGIPFLEGLPAPLEVPSPSTNEKLSIMFGDTPATNQGPLLSTVAATPQPRASWDVPPLEQPYTLLVWDPDAPRPSGTRTPYLHWLVMNIGGSTDSTGSTIVPWAPPTPPAGTGEHRYIFGLFQQASRIKELPEAPTERSKFPLTDFASKHSLSLLAAKGIRVAAIPS